MVLQPFEGQGLPTNCWPHIHLSPDRVMKDHPASFRGDICQHNKSPSWDITTIQILHDTGQQILPHRHEPGPYPIEQVQSCLPSNHMTYNVTINIKSIFLFFLLNWDSNPGLLAYYANVPNYIIQIQMPWKLKSLSCSDVVALTSLNQ